MPGPLPLPVPYIPGVPGSGLGDPQEFASNVQQNLDAIATAVGGAAVLNAGDAAGGALAGTYPNPSLATGTVLALASTGTTRKVAFGTGTVTFTASDQSAQVTVAHGLGGSPVCVVCMPKSPAAARLTIQETATADATNFYVSGFQTSNTAISLSQSFYWLAIG